MSQIVTLTLNPCIDAGTTIEGLVPEKKLRCSPPVFEPGGGGINVSRVLRRLGGRTVAVYPAGGHTGNFLQELVGKEGLDAIVVPAEGSTRENLIVLDGGTNQQYRFGMPGPALSEKEWQACLDAVASVPEAGYIVASGSLPEGVPLDIFARLARTARRQGARLIVDTSGEALRAAVEEGVYLLKPNLAELSALAGVSELAEEEIDEAARAIIGKGHCEAVVVSVGAGGARLITENDHFPVAAPVVRRRSTVGAGDSMVAGMVYCHSTTGDLRSAVQYGVACGTAATMNPGTELCHKEDVERLFQLIRK
ncbi:MAG TPA: 1-phosphofructokinase family hexose kinase [Chitinophagaceae bacterium]|nr:1-phosphofructokinase family hexose kinase [Chitinophagaceae bacterium]